MKQETDVEMLARLMAEGFGQVNGRLDGMDTRFDVVDARLDKVDARLDSIDTRLDSIDSDLIEVNDRLLGLEKGNADLYRHIDDLERKREGMMLSLDETVARDEFAALARRVDVLEHNR